MKKQLFSTKNICIYGIGISLYVIMSAMLSIPIPNSFAHIDLGYAIMTIYAYIYGSIAGFVIGTFGRILVDLLMYGGLGTPGWLIASACMGYAIGVIFMYLKNLNSKYIFITLSSIFILIVNAILLIGFAPYISSLWNGTSYLAVLPTGFSAFVTDSISIIFVGIPIGQILDKIISKSK